MVRTPRQFRRTWQLYRSPMPLLFPDRVSVRGRRTIRRIASRVIGSEEAKILESASPEDRAIALRWSPFTLASPERVLASIDAARYVCRGKVPGAIVECGVWRGGCSGAMLDVITEEGQGQTRVAFLYDTFEGMSAPTEKDLDVSGRSAKSLLGRSDPKAEPDGIWCVASLEDVRENIRRSKFAFDRVQFVPGPVEETLMDVRPDSIAVLRLDTDWYESTAAELFHLYDLVEPGGVVIVDDYGHWQGARRAVDEFLQSRGLHPLLARSDYTGRMFIKPSN
jgi:O-methyltransferase